MSKTKSKVDAINERGLARGWHAEMLLEKAKRLGKTMADVFKEQSSDTFAFCVPAKCTKLTSTKVEYEFIDGSTIALVNPNAD